MARLLEKAKDTLHNGGFSIVVLNQNNEYVSSESGISALLLLLKDKPDMLRGASVADSVGKRCHADGIWLLARFTRELSVARLLCREGGLTLHYDRLVPIYQ